MFKWFCLAVTVVALTVPDIMQLRLTFVSGFVLDALPGWAATLALPIPERKKALADPEVRRRLGDAAASPEAGVFRAIAAWEHMRVAETFESEFLPCQFFNLRFRISSRDALSH